MTTDAIVHALWGGDAPPNAEQTVRTYVSRLRKLLTAGSSSPLSSGRGGYRLTVPNGGIDVDELETLVAAGRSALDRADPAEAEQLLTRAASLVRGHALADLGDLEIFRLERARLDELLDLVEEDLVEEDLVEAHLAQGRHRELVPRLRAQVGATPHRERPWAQLMLALYRSGRQAEALAAYREARAALRRELGLEPSRELQRLERMILLQERTLDHAAVGLLHGVPRYATSLHGREETLADVCRLVRRRRLVSLVGAAGVGKTRLAAETTMRLRPLFADGIWWVDLSAAAPDEVRAALAAALVTGGAGPVGADPVGALRGLRALLVVDNCEHLLDEAAVLLDTVLTETSGVHLLATSREPVRVDAEHVLRIEPLSLPDLRTPGAHPSSQAIDLLAARAGLERERIGRLQERALGEVATLLDGLPLAIELAARRLEVMTAAELARALEQRLQVLSSGNRAGPARQRTLEAAIRWSYELLTDEERRLLLRLAPFRGHFGLAAATAVAAGDDIEPASVVPLLLRLVERSLVSTETGEATRYRLLATTREFVAREAAEQGELDGAASRHRDYYLDLGEQIASHMVGPGLSEWLPIAHAEHENLLGALRWSLERREGEEALQLASALARYWYRTSYLTVARTLLEQALELAPRTSRHRPRGLVSLAWLAVAGRDPDAAALARAAAGSTRAADEHHGFALLALASALLERTSVPDADLAEAEGAIGKARTVLAAIGHAEGTTMTGQLLGVASFHRGELTTAYRLLEGARDDHRRLRGSLDAGWALVQLARVALALGDVDAARSAAGDAVADFRTRRDPRGLASAYTALARVHRRLGDDERGDQLLEEAARLAELHGYRSEAAEAAAARRV